MLTGINMSSLQRAAFLLWVLLCLFFTRRSPKAAEILEQIADLNAGPAGSYPSNYIAVGNSIYFSAYTINSGRELWKYDGTNLTLAADINETVTDLGNGILEGNSSSPNNLTLYSGQLYFSAFDPRRGGELW